MYRMKQFAAMTGMTQSKIRFYEKHGLVLSDRMENGYRVFTPEDAFRSNAFRVLLQYGFSISEAIEMLDAKQDTAEFRESLQEQHRKLERERILLDYRQRRIESVLDVLETDGKVDFKLVHIPDQLYVNASHGRDFTVSMENEKVLAEYYDLLSITSCARIITKENLLDSSPSVDPDYINTVSVEEEHFLSPYAREHVKRLRLGRCLRFRRMVTPARSLSRRRRSTDCSSTSMTTAWPSPAMLSSCRCFSTWTARAATSRYSMCLSKRRQAPRPAPSRRAGTASSRRARRCPRRCERS